MCIQVRSYPLPFKLASDVPAGGGVRHDPQRCRRAVEGLSSSPMAEMLLRAQAARRALSTLADEIAGRAGGCGGRAHPTSLEDGGVSSGGGASHLSGHRSDAISKLAQSRAGALSSHRAAPSPSASPLSLLPADRAPPSPLAEITNTGALRGLAVGASVREVLAGLESGSKSPGVTNGRAPSEISHHLEEQFRFRQAPVRWGPVTPVAATKSADLYPSWNDASARPAVQLNTFKAVPAHSKTSRALNNDNIENTNPSVLSGGSSSSSKGQEIMQDVKGVSKEIGNGNKTSPVLHERKNFSIATNRVRHGASCHKTSQTGLSTKKRALDTNETLQCKPDGLVRGGMTNRFNVGDCEMKTAESERCLDCESKGTKIDLQCDESWTKSEKYSRLDLNPRASEKPIPAVHGPTESCKAEEGNEHAENKISCAKQQESRLGMLIKIQVKGIKGACCFLINFSETTEL